MGLDDFRTGEPDEKPEYPDEDIVEKILVEYFEEEFPDVRGDDDHQMDIPDVIAEDEDITWGVEVKGDADSNKQRVYSALGQVVYEMTISQLNSDNIRWGIAFPESINGRTPYRERISKNVSRGILEMLDIHVFFVKESGEVNMIPPGDIGVEE